MQIEISSKLHRYYYIRVSENNEIILELVVEKCENIDINKLATVENDGTFYFNSEK